MKDTVIKGNGKSRSIKAPTDMPETFEEWRTQLLAGTATLDIGLNAAGCDAVGTALTKANMLSDTTKSALELTDSDPTVNDALYALNQKDSEIKTLIAKCGNCDVVTGSYTGTGAHDTGSTLTLNFEGTPVLVIIHTKTYKIHGNDTMLLVRGAEWAFSSDDDHTNYRCSVSWGSKSVSWTPQDNAYAGMNGENTDYVWVAFVKTK